MKTNVLPVKLQCFFVFVSIVFRFAFCCRFFSYFDLHLVLPSLCASRCKQAGDVDRFIRQLVNRGNGGPSVTQVKDILA